jgi:hypothetical protein
MILGERQGLRLHAPKHAIDEILRGARIAFARR